MTLILRTPPNVVGANDVKFDLPFLIYKTPTPLLLFLRFAPRNEIGHISTQRSFY